MIMTSKNTIVIKIDNDIELRQLLQEDAKDIFVTINSQREHLGKWLPFVEFTQTISDSEQFVDSIVNAPKKSAELVFTIREKDLFIGLIGFKDTDKTNRKTEIGYWLSEHAQKRGIMTKAVKALCDLAFEQMDMNRIQIKCAVGNISSSNIPKRLGFSFEGIERQGELLTGNILADLEIYSRLKEDKI